MSTTAVPPTRRSSPAALRTTLAAGWSLVAIAVLHTAFFAFDAPWGDWIDGELRGGEADAESVAVFWALPGGVVMPVLLFAALLIKTARSGRRVGAGFGLALAAWAGFCAWLVGPSGFLTVFVPAGLLVLAAVLDRRG